MSGEAVKVIVRCRPLNEREKNLNCTICVQMESQRGQCMIQNPSEPKTPPKPFFFDGAYFMDSTTEAIYADIAYPLVEGVTEGYNGTIFAYGQTGCGKSFSMQGINEPATQRGIIPRSFDHIFETISVSENLKFLVHASYLEIYNEEIRDLLGKDIRSKLELKEHPEKGVYVAGLSMHKVASVRECQTVMERGWKNRSTGATLMNAESSRSHSIFTISLEMAEMCADGEEKIRAGKLNLVDLAGSERQSKTGSTGDRLKEATKINLSLSALGNVISALVDGKSKHIPYRDSKLTRLLQDSLGGNTKTLMVACLSPADNNYDETLSTLRYANRAKNIQNKPKINEDPKDALLREYQEQIEKLKAMLAGQIPINPSMMSSAPTITVTSRQEALEREREQLCLEYEEKLRAKEELYAQEAADKAKLSQEMQLLREFYDNKILSLDEQFKGLPNSAQVLTNSRKSDSSTTNLECQEDNLEVRPNFEYSNNDTTTTRGNDHKLRSLVSAGGANSRLPAPEVGVVIMGQDGAVSIDSRTADRPSTPDEHYKNRPTGQQAVYIRSQTAIANEKSEEASNPDPDSAMSTAFNKEEVIMRAGARLQALEAVMVGGEAVNNAEILERRRSRKKHVEERKKRLAEANHMLEDDGIIVGIYESIQDELRAKVKQLAQSSQHREALEREIIDLQSEFEFDRIDYLDSIRKQDRQVQLLSAILERVQPLIRRDCNYSNLDRIKSLAKFDEETNQWKIPQVIIERTALPAAMNASLSSSHGNGSHLSMGSGYGGSVTPERDYDPYDNGQEARLFHKMADRESTQGYFGSNRANQILAESRAAESGKLLTRQKMSALPVNTNLYVGNRVVSPLGQQQSTTYFDDESNIMRRPLRLEALPSTAGRRGRKKSRDL